MNNTNNYLLVYHINTGKDFEVRDDILGTLSDAFAMAGHEAQYNQNIWQIEIICADTARRIATISL